MTVKDYLKDVIATGDTQSSRKFVTLVIAGLFIIAQFVILFIATYVIFNVPKGKVDVDVLNFLKEIMRYDFYIILSGLGFVTSSDLVSMIVSSNKTTEAPDDEPQKAD